MENTVVEEFRNGLKEIKSGVELTKNDIRATAENIKTLQDDTTQLRSDLDRLRRQQLNGTGKPKLRAGEAVTEDCARWFGALAFAGAELQGKLQGNPRREAIMHIAREVLGLETRSAITSTDIPLPIVYVGEVTELVYKYGQFRKYATVYPMSVGTVKLPQLKTSPAFGFINQSANVPEKSPQINFVTFTAQKAGGIVRIPSEIDEDSVVPLGQFIARYVARETARWEDTVGYLADGTGTYNNISGIGKYAVTGGLVLQTATTKTKPSDITIADFRNVRAKVNGAALFNSAYYCHPSMEALLVSFNTSATVTPYIANGPGGPTLDGFPVRWVGVLPVYDQSAHVNQVQALFGDHSYWFLGERSMLSVEISRDVYFTTDEIGIRALERFDVEAMATDAMAAIQLAAS
jgi:HK97 family phage major capsid protein